MTETTMDTNANEMSFPSLDRLEKRLPAFVKWLREGWSDARPLEVRRSGKFDWLVDKGTPMVDAYDATGGDIADVRHAIWCVLGVGTGKALCDLIEKAGRHVARFIIMEDDRAIWKTALETSNLAQYMAASAVFPIWNLKEINVSAGMAISNPILLGSVNRTLFFPQRGENEKDPKKISQYVRAYGEFLQFRFSGLGNSAEDTLIGFRQIVRNYPNLVKSYSLNDLRGKFSDRAAIIISAGPSLDKNIHLLKDVQDKCILIAVDTILRKLLPLGIRPHFVVAIERGREVYDYHFTDLPADPEGIIPVICSVCVPEICGAWKGPFVMPFKTLPLDAWFAAMTTLPVLQSGSSCAHMGIPLAELLGCRTIALMGQDLAYAPDGATHSKGTTWEKDEKRKRFDAVVGETFETEGLRGGTVRTNRIWYFFKGVFEEFIALRPRIAFYNATEGGVRIEGAQAVTLDEFLEENVRSQQSMSQRPLDLLATRPLSEDSSREKFIDSVEEALDSLKDYKKLLEQFDETIKSTAAPGLSVQKRQSGAWKVAAIMDRIVASSPIMSFILQAHFAGCARVMNETKRLDDPETFLAWKNELQEFVGTARTACVSAEEMLDALIRFDQEESEHAAIFEEIGRPEGPLSPEEAERAWEIAQERHLSLFALSLYSRFDFRKGEWRAENALRLGRRSLELGLVERARKLLSSLVQHAELKNDPSFWNDLAMSHCLYDFSIDPNFDLARSAFQKAMILDPDNEARSRNYLAMEFLVQKRAEAAYRYAPAEHRRNAAAAIGQSWAFVGKHEKAIEWFRRALEHSGNDEGRSTIEGLIEQSLKKSKD